MKIEITLKVMDPDEKDLDMKLSSEDTYRDLLTFEFMDGEGNIRGQYEASKEEFVSVMKQFEKGG